LIKIIYRSVKRLRRSNHYKQWQGLFNAALS